LKYVSTRGAYAASPLGFSEVILSGLAEDGGLCLPTHYPKVDSATLAKWRGLSYADLAFEVISLYCDDIPATDLKTLLDKTYTKATFGTEEITPLTHLSDGLILQQLSNGPTLAFKDMAMQWLGNAFEYELTRRQQTLNILAATSGDTGSAAEYAMRGKQGINVFMLSPAGRMSAFQRAQMYSLPDANIHNIAMQGWFDDCQDVVKAVSSDLAFKAQFNLGTVNSINWGRIVAQIVYYFKGYFAATSSNAERVSFCVPSGNFGNIMAGHIAREMGCPIERLILATNENNVLEEFFKTGVYKPRDSAHTFETSSPSMDISKASNFERFVFDLVGRNPGALNKLWQDLAKDGQFDISATPLMGYLTSRYGFVSGHSTHADRLATIKQVYESEGLFIDTHTADAVKVARELKRSDERVIALETALPIKFAVTIEEATGKQLPLTPEQTAMMALPLRVTEMPADAELMKSYIRQHA
jgi:threonine synthase